MLSLRCMSDGTSRSMPPNTSMIARVASSIESCAFTVFSHVCNGTGTKVTAHRREVLFVRGLMELGDPIPIA